MHNIINTLHSYNRYLILAALVFVLYRSWTGWQGRKAYGKNDNLSATILLGLAHLQLLLGLIQYFGTSTIVKSALADMGNAMKTPWLRYFAVEHITIMILGIACIQIGRSLSKKAADDTTKHKKIAIWTTAATVLIIAGLAMKGLLFSTVAAANSGL
ncbi:MAG: hypothetical protein JNJ57_08265 [Saprospiraceae bacterium]|nr:hypothetical protein [Saprospiraceae bacterium]